MTPSEGEAFRLRSADATHRSAVLTNRFKSGRIDSRVMKNGNLVLAGVATVVVALCLIFSFIYLQGDSQDGPAGYDTDTLRTDVVAGDYYVVEMTSDGADFQTPQRFTVLAMIVDDGRILYQSTISQYSWTTAEEFANVLPAGAEPVRTEVIDTAFGERECQVYLEEAAIDTYAWYSNGCLYRLQVEVPNPDSALPDTVITFDIVESTLYSDAAPEHPQADVKEPEVGDWMAYDTIVIDAGTGATINQTATREVIESMDGDNVQVRTFTNGVDQGLSVYPKDVFLTGIGPDFDGAKVGSGAFMLDGGIVSCDRYVASDEVFTINALIVDGMTLCAFSEYEGYLGIICITDTSLI